MANEFIARKGIISLDSAQVTGSLSVTGNISASIFSGSFVGNGSQLTGVSAGFPYTGSARITGSLVVTGSVSATTFLGDGSQLTGIGSPVPVTATVNTGSSPLTLTTQSIVVADSTNGNLIVNLPDLNTIVGTSNQKPIIVYKNDYSQNVIYVQPSGSQLVNGASQDIIVSIQLAVIYNPTSAGWVTEGTSAQSLAELELFFLSLTETGSLATTGSNRFNGNQIVTGSLTVTGGITGSATSASYVEYANVANKPTLVSSSAQIVGYGIFATTGSNQFNGSQAITGSLTVTGQVVAQTLNVQQVTSSIVYSSGSNIFGNSLGNTQQFTGSVSVTGSLAISGTGAFSGALSLNSSANRINSGNELRFYRTDNGIYTQLYDGGAANGFVLDNRNGDGFNFQSAGTSQFRIASTGVATFSGSLRVGGAEGNFLIDSYTTTKIGVRSWTNIAGTTNNFFVQNSSNFNYGIVGVVSATGTSTGDVYGLGYSPSAGTSMTPVLNWTSGGFVGIGTTSPSQKLEVVGGEIKAGRVDSSSEGGQLSFGRASDNATAWYIDVYGNTSTPDLRFVDVSNSAVRMTINSSGNVGIGTDNPGYKLDVQASVAGYVFNSQNTRNVSGDGNALFLLGNNANNTSSYFLICSMASGDKMYIYGNGNIVNINNSYGALSDIKLKENIQDATPKLDDLLKVKIRNYNLIGEETKQIGVIAQELEEVFPGLVNESADFEEVEITDEEGNTTKERQPTGTTTKSVKYSVFVPMLIKAIQEQQSQIESLKAEIQTLKQ